MNDILIKKGERQRLKAFMESNFDFYILKKAGFFEKGIRKIDYEKQAERVCHFFTYKSIYEYKRPCDCIKCKTSFWKNINKCEDEEVGVEFKPLEINLLEILTTKKWLN